MDDKLLKFVAFESAVEAGFWWNLSRKKLDVYGLDEKPVVVVAFYQNGLPSRLPPRLNLDYSAFDTDFQEVGKRCAMFGKLYAKNTLESFKECDKSALIGEIGKQMWEDITSGNALKNPELLNKFLLLTYVDLKKYYFYYWFAFPAFLLPAVINLSSISNLSDRFTPEQLLKFTSSFDDFASKSSRHFFAVHVTESKITVQTLESYAFIFAEQEGEAFLGFCDPSCQEEHPGWPLRNLLCLASQSWKDQSSYKVICLRDRMKDSVRHVGHSLVLNVSIGASDTVTEMPGVVGWEKNERQKRAPRRVDLSATMDPTKLAESAVDLNLKLMRWRLVPTLDLDKIRAVRCLLLGSGTLGCNVARCLLGWGVRNITFVDNGKVSYSNPVRQTLFAFDDCLNGGAPKAETAAEALRKIFPQVNASGVTLSVPMPGHFVTERTTEQVARDVKTLECLIESHDAVFLLMDTRESRWLPTVIAAAKQKIVITAALGFDTFLAMRHGLKVQGPSASVDASTRPATVPGQYLGCYFCNDVVAPGDSTRNRTMDQQCTVTRPGLSMMAASTAVELMVSIVQHPDGGLAPADMGIQEGCDWAESQTALGIVPHQVRCFLSRFANILPVCRAFDRCTACSSTVLQGYKDAGFDFLIKAFNEPTFLEDITGLTLLHRETQSSEVWELSDDD